MAISYLTISYPTFIHGQIIDPDQANQNNSDIINKTNDIIDGVNTHANKISLVEGKLANVDANGVYVGPLTAEQINVISGITLSPDAVISWDNIAGTEEVAFRDDINWDNVLNKPIELLTQQEFILALTDYVTTNNMSTALANTLTFGNFMTAITKDYIASMNLIVGDEITMGVNAKIDWNNVTNAPTPEDWVVPTDISDIAGLSEKLTYINSSGIYTGILSAQQVNALLINGVQITALDELAVRGYANTTLGVNPKLAFQCADSVGESYIKCTPVNPGATDENDTLLLGINSKDVDGTNEAVRGGLYMSGTGGTQVDHVVNGTIQVGEGSGLSEAPWGVNKKGMMYWNPPDGTGRCSVTPGEEAIRIGAGENYIRINQPKVGGTICDFVTMNEEGQSVAVASIGLSSGITSNIPSNTAITWASDGTAFTESENGIVVTWTVVKNGDGKITNLTSTSGDNIVIGY